MRKLLLIISTVFIAEYGCAQTQLWGMTEWGGQYNSGTIFNTDGSGTNHTVQKSFFRANYGNCNDNLLEASDGKFYGMTLDGGANGFGVIFRFDPTDSSTTNILDFNDSLNGRSPRGSLIQASDGMLYGMTFSGGTFGMGVIFRINPLTAVYTKLLDFSGASNGANPSRNLMQASDGFLYGVTPNGGTWNEGVIFRFDPVTLTDTVLVNFHGAIFGTGRIPQATLIQATDGMLYGTTSGGGINGYGILFQFSPVNFVLTKLFDFDQVAFGGFPSNALLQGSDGLLYGLTGLGGLYNDGVMFKYNLATASFTKIFDFTGVTNGATPGGYLIEATDGTFYGLTSHGGTNNKGVIFQFDPATSIFTKRFDFDGTETGGDPKGSLMQASDGKLYGLTYDGGAMNFGFLFQFDPLVSTYSKLHTFLEEPNGKFPCSSLIQASDGKLYGLNSAGGESNKGVLFQFDPIDSIIINKYEFQDPASGSQPNGSLLQASDGMLYGMTNTDGANGFGVMFKYNLTTSTYTKELDFDGAVNGKYPMGNLIQATDGLLYGMAFHGGINDKGVIFKFDPVTSVYTKLLDFDGTTTGAYPLGSLFQTNDGLMYGMTISGGTNDLGILFQFDPTSSGFTDLFDFTGINDGSYPAGNLIQATDGKLYGMTTNGGLHNDGVIFQYDLSTHAYLKRMDFDSVPYGRLPQGSLLQATDGKLYGMCFNGGTYDYGTIFQFDPITSICTKTFDFDRIHGEGPLYGNLIEISTNFSIATSALPTTICAGTTLTIPFTISGIFYNTNNFTVQLSDATGSFASAIPIGILSSLSSGNINGMIPINTPAGNGYRIRVVSSNPAIIGSNNGTDITINSSPVITTGTIITSGCSMNTGSLNASVAGGTSPYTYEWLPGNFNSLTYSNIPSGNYTFTVIDSNNCADTLIMALGDSCSYVWPGDANEDAIADNNDILSIGIANGATGSSRANATINWIGQDAANWGQTFANGTDYKYADCDGSGIIQPADTIAVIQNFGFTHTMRTGNAPVYDATLPDLKITMGQDTIPTSSSGTLTVSVGSASNQVSNLYGLAFTLNFDPAEIDATSFRMNENGSWMGIPGTDLIGVVMNSGTGTGSVQIAITRLNHTDTSGFGTIANLSYMTTNTLTGTGNYQNVNFTISNVSAISANEINQILNMVNDSVVVVDSVVFNGIDSHESSQQISIYPNPSSGKFILSSGIGAGIISVTNIAGEIVFQSTVSTPASTIDLHNQPDGIYFVNVKSEKGSFTQKIIICK
jgi:uncharacterized repeat protein (TIGR03803 family)